MTGVNVPLLRKAVEWAEEQASREGMECQWVQRAWLTSQREHATLLALGEIDKLVVTPEDQNELTERVNELLDATTDCGTAYCIAGYIAQLEDERYKDSEWADGIHSSTFAAQRLGIPVSPGYTGEEEEEHLFAATNTIEDVRRIAEELAGEPL